METKDKLYSRRKELGLTLEEIGNIVGVSKSTVRKWETGDIENMKRDKIALLAKALDCDPAYLMGWTDNPGTDGTVYFPRISKKTGHYTDRKPREEVERLYRYIEELPSEAIVEAESYLEFLKNKYSNE